MQFLFQYSNPFSRFVLGLWLGLCFHLTSHAQFAQWELNGDLLSSTGQPPLALEAYPPASDPQIQFVSDTIQGVATTVLEFSRGTSLVAFPCFKVLNDLEEICEYSLIVDIKFLSEKDGPWTDGFISLINITPRDIILQDLPGSDGEWFISPEGIGISGKYKGQIYANRWHRLAMVIHQPEGIGRFYIDGELVNERNGYKNISRYSFQSFLRLFADNNRENCRGRLACVQIQQEDLDDAALGRISAPTAEGIPLPPTPTFSDVIVPATNVLYSGNEYSIQWKSANPQGVARIDLFHQGNHMRRLQNVAMKEGRYTWRVPPSVPDGDGYQFRIAWLGDEKIMAYSDSYAVKNPRSPLSPSFGKQLIQNPQFDHGLVGWKVVSGSPEIVRQKQRYDQIHRLRYGENMLSSHEADDWTIEQTVDLIEHGFSAEQLDEPIKLIAYHNSKHVFYKGLEWCARIDRHLFNLEFLDIRNRLLSKIQSIEITDEEDPICYLPRGTRKIRASIDADHIIDAVNDFTLERVVLYLQADFPPPPAEITLEPWIQNIQPHALTVLWETNTNAYPAYVEWGENNTQERIAKPYMCSCLLSNDLDKMTKMFVHKATLTPLRPGVRYSYRVCFGDRKSQEYSFVSPPNKEVEFWVGWMSDMEDPIYVLRFERNVSRLASHKPNLLIIPGKIGEGGHNWKRDWFPPLHKTNLAQTIPIVYPGSCSNAFRHEWWDYSVFPEDVEWFAFSYGDVRFILLDSDYKDMNYPEGVTSRQTEWLEEQLNSPEWKNAAFRIVVCHQPPFSNYRRDVDLFDGNPRVREEWVPLFEKYKADLVVSGYIPPYHRGQRNGVTYVTVGGVSKIIHEENKSAEWEFWDKVVLQHHFAVMKVDGDTLTWTTYNIDDEIVDMFEIKKQ